MTTFLTYAFYIFTCLPIMYEVFVFNNTERAWSFIKWDNDIKPDMDVNRATYHIFAYCYTLWMIIGLLSSQYILFACLFCLSLMPRINTALLKIDALISLLVLFSIILNKYYFHYPINVILNNYVSGNH